MSASILLSRIDNFGMITKRTTNYDKIKVRPMDINTKGEFPQVV